MKNLNVFDRAIGSIRKIRSHLIGWQPPLAKDDNGKTETIGHRSWFGAANLMLVLDETGRVDKLDRQTRQFVGMFGRETHKEYLVRFITALIIILPSILLSCALAWKVRTDATVVGFSGPARKYWIIATIAFGLPAYITYRLTRPGIALVTCPSCGRPRSPDMNLCHRCRSRWHVPELTPPTWRVLDNPPTAAGAPEATI